jgi:hypothetical protein
MSLIRFGRTERERDPLLAKVAELPDSMAPGRDLWPAIRKAIAGEQPGGQPVARGLPWQWAVAAGVAVASVSVLFTWMAVGPAGDGMELAGMQPAAVAALQPVSYGDDSRLGPEYVAVRAEMFELFKARLAELPDDTRMRIEQNLAAIQRAADDIDAALADDPASRLLNQLLLSTYQDEIDLYSSVAATAEAAGRRT